MIRQIIACDKCGKGHQWDIKASESGYDSLRPRGQWLRISDSAHRKGHVQVELTTTLPEGWAFEQVYKQKWTYRLTCPVCNGKQAALDEAKLPPVIDLRERFARVKG